MRYPGRGLTLAAIEKPTLAAHRPDGVLGWFSDLPGSRTAALERHAGWVAGLHPAPLIAISRPNLQDVAGSKCRDAAATLSRLRRCGL